MSWKRWNIAYFAHKSPDCLSGKTGNSPLKTGQLDCAQQGVVHKCAPPCHLCPDQAISGHICERPGLASSHLPGGAEQSISWRSSSPAMSDDTLAIAPWIETPGGTSGWVCIHSCDTNIQPATDEALAILGPNWSALLSQNKTPHLIINHIYEIA